MKKLYTLICFLVIAALPASSFALIDIEAAVGVWGASPSGDFSYKSTLDYDFEDTFGFEDEAFPMARFKIELPVIPNIYLMATPMKFEGTTNQDFIFDNTTYTATTNTELIFNQYDIGFYYGVPFLGLASLGTFHVDAGLNLRIIQMDATMSYSDSSLSRNESVTLPVPMLYLAADLSPIDLFVIEAEIRALPVNDLEVISAIARLKVNIPGPFYVAGGYRHETVAVDQDDFDIDIKFSGPFAEAGFKF